MYCPHCGAEISNLSGDCKACGSRLVSQTVAAPDGGYSLFNASSQFQTESALQPVGVVRGWLLCFCILTAIVEPVLAFAGEGPSRLGLIRVVFGAVTAILVWSIRSTALSWLRSYFVIAIITKLVALFRIGSVGIFVSLLITGAWVLYFCTSERVKFTLGANLLDLTETAPSSSS